MPTFLDVVKFLNDRAEVANHPFFTQNSYESRLPRRPEDGRKLHLRHLTTLTTNVSGEGVKPDSSKAMRTIKCMLCSQSHPLYRCDAFKSKSVEQKGNLFPRKTSASTALIQETTWQSHVLLPIAVRYQDVASLTIHSSTNQT